MRTRPLVFGVLCLSSALLVVGLWRESPHAAPLQPEAAMGVRGGQSGTCYVDYENSCTFGISNEWLKYGDQDCTGVPCQQANAAGAYQCAYTLVYDSNGAAQFYPDCEDEGDSAPGGYVGKIDGNKYDCGFIDTCDTTLNGCRSGFWGKQLRCRIVSTSVDEEPTCSPDATTAPCPSAMRFHPRLWALARANGIEAPAAPALRRVAVNSSRKRVQVNRSTRRGS